MCYVRFKSFKLWISFVSCVTYVQDPDAENQVFDPHDVAREVLSWEAYQKAHNERHQTAKLLPREDIEKVCETVVMWFENRHFVEARKFNWKRLYRISIQEFLHETVSEEEEGPEEGPEGSEEDPEEGPEKEEQPAVAQEVAAETFPLAEHPTAPDDNKVAAQPTTAVVVANVVAAQSNVAAAAAPAGANAVEAAAPAVVAGAAPAVAAGTAPVAVAAQTTAVAVGAAQNDMVAAAVRIVGTVPLVAPAAPVAANAVPAVAAAQPTHVAVANVGAAQSNVVAAAAAAQPTRVAAVAPFAPAVMSIVATAAAQPTTAVANAAAPVAATASTTVVAATTPAVVNIVAKAASQPTAIAVANVVAAQSNMTAAAVPVAATAPLAASIPRAVTVESLWECLDVIRRAVENGAAAVAANDISSVIGRAFLEKAAASKQIRRSGWSSSFEQFLHGVLAYHNNKYMLADFGSMHVGLDMEDSDRDINVQACPPMRMGITTYFVEASVSSISYVACAFD